MKTNVEMVTCGKDGFATNKGEVLLRGELWWGGHREIYMINSADGFGKKEEKTSILFLSITQKPRDYPLTILQNNPSSGPSCGWDSNPLKGGTLEREYQ